jgi:hypothetical protein
MSTRFDQSDASRQAFKAPVAVAREERDPPTADVLVNKSVARGKKNVTPLEGASPMPEDRQERIALAAYYMAERRGFEPGHEIEDWLAAESQVSNEST